MYNILHGDFMEYKEFAKYYDKFYSKKKYQKEVLFLKHFIKENDSIIDIGCGTGMHAYYLKDYNIDGLDLNEEMLDIAKKRIKGKLYKQNILDVKIDKKYNIIISMFAVINHLTNIEQLKKCLINLKNILLPNGKIILDLHNPQSSGKKIDCFDNIKRTMIWNYDKKRKIEKSNIVFEIDNMVYNDFHTFRIFSIDEIKKSCQNVGLRVIEVYENYDILKRGNTNSKNLQFLIECSNLTKS